MTSKNLELVLLLLAIAGCSNSNFNGKKSAAIKNPTSGSADSTTPSPSFTPEAGENITDETIEVSKGDTSAISKDEPDNLSTSDGGATTATPSPTPSPTPVPCGGELTSDGCFYGIGQHTKYPIDVGLTNAPLSCDNFCSTRGGSHPISLTCAQCAPLFNKLYSGPNYACSASPAASNPKLMLPTGPNDVAGLNAIYTSSCSVVYIHSTQQAHIAAKYAPTVPDYSLNFGKVYSGGAAHWSSYICRCKN